ncbi:Protein fem-1 B [Porites harrisoni]
MAYNRIKQIFEAVEARDAVLLNEILESMNGSERASVLTLLFRRERSDDREYVCCSQATDRWVSRKRRLRKRYVSSAFPDSKSPLVTAVKNGDLDSVKVLFKHHLHIGVPFREGLFLSAVNGNTDILRCFIENKADVDARTGNCHCTLLIVASKYGHTNAVNVLLQYGANVALTDKSGRTALHFAAGSSDNSCEILRGLIENGADIDKGRNDNQTPLMIAAQKGHVSVATFLIEHGANVDLQDENGNTALHHTLYGSDVSCEILSCLTGSGADVNGVNKVKHTPLMIAAKRGHLNALTLLIKHGAHDVDLQDSDGYTALHYAVYSSDISCEILSCLIGIGADVNARTNNGVTPLMIAAEEGHINGVTSLVKCGANVDLQDKYGNTALHYAAGLSVDERFSDDLPEIVETLLDLGASHMCNHQGLKPLHQASISGNIAVVEYLIQRPEITREQRVDALELLGASLATQFSHISLLDFLVWEGLMYIKLGMEERFVDPSQPILKQPKEPAYGNRKESQTPEELAQIEGDTEAILMESLLIKERILGTNHSELLPSIRFVCRQGNLTDPSLLIALYRRAVDIAQKSNLSALDDFQEISHLLHKICSGSNHLKEKDLLELLRQIVIEYEKQHTKRRRLNDNKQYCQELVREDLFDCSLELVLMISKSEFCDERNASSLTMLLRKLFMKQIRNRSGNTLLHEFIKRYTDDDDDYLSPCLQAVNLLLNEGFNVNVVNDEGNTPLHIAVMLEPRNDKLYLVTEILQLLFYGGAHHDFVNNDGKTPMDMAKTDEARMILSERRKLELKCISAKAVKKFGIPYLGVVPKTLENYISRH